MKSSAVARGVVTVVLSACVQSDRSERKLKFCCNEVGGRAHRPVSLGLAGSYEQSPCESSPRWPAVASGEWPADDRDYTVTSAHRPSQCYAVRVLPPQSRPWPYLCCPGRDARQKADGCWFGVGSARKCSNTRPRAAGTLRTAVLAISWVYASGFDEPAGEDCGNCCTAAAAWRGDQVSPDPFARGARRGGGVGWT